MKSAVIIILILVVIVLGFVFLGGGEETNTPLPSPLTNEPAVGALGEPPTGAASQPENTVTVTYENNAFNPATVSIRIGDMVVFENRHIAPIRVSSNPHPIHTSYPDLESGSLSPAGTYGISFEQAGTVNYHNHFNPGVTGKIIVE